MDELLQVRPERRHGTPEQETRETICLGWNGRHVRRDSPERWGLVKLSIIYMHNRARRVDRERRNQGQQEGALRTGDCLGERSGRQLGRVRNFHLCLARC
jgi:hypothetical protein